MKEDWLKFLPRPLFLIARAAGDIGGVALVGMMLITVADVFGRNLGFGSIEAVVELTSVGVVITAAMGLAVTTALGGHIIIDLVTRKNRHRTNRIIDSFWLAVGFVILAALSGLALNEGLTLHASGSRTEVMEWTPLIPHTPAAIGWGLSALVCGWIAIAAWWRLFISKAYDEAEDDTNSE